VTTELLKVEPISSGVMTSIVVSKCQKAIDAIDGDLDLMRAAAKAKHFNQSDLPKVMEPLHKRRLAYLLTIMACASGNLVPKTLWERLLEDADPE
jgi:hypothetical protein